MSNKVKKIIRDFGKKLNEDIENSENIFIVTHYPPDIDATCSCLILKDFIENNFKDKKVRIEESNKRNLILYPEIDDIVTEDRNTRKFDLCIIVDSPLPRKISKGSQEIIKNSEKSYLIDHHNAESDKWYEGINKLIIHEYTSCCELIVDVLGVEKLSKYSLEKALDGIYSDTIELRHATKNTMRNILRIMKKGVKIDETVVRIGNILWNRITDIGKIQIGVNSKVKNGIIQITLTNEEDGELTSFFINYLLPKISYAKKTYREDCVKSPMELCIINNYRSKHAESNYVTVKILNQKDANLMKPYLEFCEKYKMKNGGRNMFYKNNLSIQELLEMNENFFCIKPHKKADKHLDASH